MQAALRAPSESTNFQTTSCDTFNWINNNRNVLITINLTRTILTDIDYRHEHFQPGMAVIHANFD